MTHFYTTLKSPLGEIVLTANDKGITGLYTPEHEFYARAKKGERNPVPFKKAVKQLSEYFKGKRASFDLPLAPEGTVFQSRVWKALEKIQYGKTKSYGEIAKLLKSPNASRAVGMANSKNPVCIIVPCHRVIGANGKLTGYAGGMKAKQWLIEHEANKFKHP
jgi:methylated-DNA-[protein]-cysteine S-methyltransferase